MTDELLNDKGIEMHVASFKLIPGKGGVYEFEVNGTLLFSKKQLGRHAEPGEIRQLLLDHFPALGLVYSVPPEDE